MRIKHIWTVLCQDSTLNQDDNLISLNKILEELSINLAPAVNNSVPLPEKINFPLNYEVVSLWLKNKTEKKVPIEIEVSFIAPDGEELFRSSTGFVFPENIKRYRSRIKIAGIVIKRSGDYVFKVKVKEDNEKEFHLVSELPLEVKMLIQATSPNQTVKN